MSWAALASQLKTTPIAPIQSTQTTTDTISIDKPIDNINNADKPIERTNDNSNTNTTQTKRSNDILHVVLDSGAFIASTLTQLTSYYTKNNSVQYYTVSNIETELLDNNSKTLYQTFPHPIIKRDVIDTPQHKTVIQFAKQTGVYYTLSQIDIEIATLAYTLECEINQYKYVQQVPTVTTKPITQPKQSKSDTDTTHSDTVQSSIAITTGNSDSDDADAGDWITADNVHLHHTPTHVAKSKPRHKRKFKQLSSIVTITTDYTLQNLLLQLHCRLHSINGMNIHKTKMFIQRCYACNTIIRDTTKEYCTSCGNHTLVKQSAYINSENELIYNKELLYTPSVRGTRYSIPKPQGGRLSKDLILSEDMMPSFKKMNKQKKQTDDTSDFYTQVSEYNSMLDMNKQFENINMYGYGKQNPNAVKRSLQRTRNT